MSKRRISAQQSTRINIKQRQYREQTEINPQNNTLNGLVITRFGKQVIVESPEHTRILCSIRPSIDSLVAGDNVVWQEEGGLHGVVVSRYPRHSVLGRPGARGQVKAVAANITRIMVVVACAPQISWPLLDSYLVMAEFLKIDASIVLNKTDLPCETIKQQLLQEYQPLGYSIHTINQANSESREHLAVYLNEQISVFVGQSGVGKSSIISRLLAEKHHIQTGSISDRTELGKHTTSASCLYHLPLGGAIIDSPGVREFGLWHIKPKEIAQGFREFKAYIRQCKFRNCSHQDTLGCALIDAVKNRLVSLNRYHNYVKIVTQLAK
jgi:ribosome biogenesis GTPase